MRQCVRRKDRTLYLCEVMKNLLLIMLKEPFPPLKSPVVYQYTRLFFTHTHLLVPTLIILSK